MATGATDSESSPIGLAGFLLLQWDGLRLQWLIGTDRVVHNLGESPAKDVKELEFVCREFKGKGLDADQVIWAHRCPPFSFWPAVLVGERAADAFHMEHKGWVQESTEIFNASVMGEEHSLVEPHYASVTEVIQAVWPQARRVSAVQSWVEAAHRQDGALGANSIYLDVGHQRTLMVRTSGKTLVQAQIIPHADAESILYHVVNALHREGLEPATAKFVVRWSGEVAKNGTRWALFSRFFPQMEMHPGFRSIQWGEHDVRRERWVSLTNLTACA